MSTTEAEYIASTKAEKEGLWLKGFVKEIFGIEKLITLYHDSQSAVFLMKNQIYHDRAKHINVRLHFIKNIV